MTFRQVLLRSLGVTLVSVMLALYSTGAGHGSYWLAILLFPYSALSVIFYHELLPFFLVLALVQFLAYGIILWLAATRRRTVIIVLSTVHVCAIAAYFWVSGTLYPATSDGPAQVEIHAK